MKDKIYTLTINGLQILAALSIIYFLVTGLYMAAWNMALTWAYVEIATVILRHLRKIASRLEND